MFRQRYIQNPSIFRTLTYLGPWHIQNPGIFRARGIFRTLSNIYDGTFCKNRYLARLKKSPNIFGKCNFLALVLNFLYFLKRNLFLYFRKRKTRKNFYFLKRKLFLCFRKWKLRKNSLCFRKLNFLML